MGRYTFLRFAEEAILGLERPSTAQEIWEYGAQVGLDKKLGSHGQTPWATLNAQLGSNVRDNEASPFTREPGRPARYGLKSIEATRNAIRRLNIDLASEIPGSVEAPPRDVDAIPAQEKAGRYPYKERDLHPFLSRMAHFELGGVYTKTIFHETSSKKNFSEWLHPDLVGFWFPFKDYNKELLQLTGNGLAITRFFSFEMKRELTLGNLRESFFQAVSNSSWAHEGYLAAANILDSESLHDELARLSGSHGIGVIELDLENPQDSQVLFPARARETIDWNAANKLARENPDFRKFLNDVRIDIENNQVHPSEYDAVPTIDELAKKWASWAQAKV